MLDLANWQIWSEQIERWPHERLRSWQASRLQEVIAHAQQIPFYRRLWRSAGIASDALGSLDDLARFPVINKQDLIKAGDQWARADAGRVAFSTRGTSGEPLLVWLSAQEEEVYIQPTMRGFRWAGFRPAETALLMSPVWHRLAACEAHAIVRLGGRCAFFWGSLGTEHIESFLATLSAARPAFVTTTAPFLLALVRRGEEAGPHLLDGFRGVRSIVAVGLPLTPRIREYLCNKLGVEDVFERSGTQEGAALDDCHFHNTPHVHEDVCYLEVLDNAGRPLPQGARGRLVVTKLTAAGSIFVRYDTGDIAAFAPGPCACKCGFRRLKIFGRPESAVKVAQQTITAYDVRECVERDPAMVGRNILLVRAPASPSGVLSLAIEGDERNGGGTARRLRERFGVGEVKISWLGGVRVNWGFRQVIEGREIGLGDG